MIVIPIRTVTGLNAREHFRVRAKRVKAERETTAWKLRDQPRPTLPCSVILTRISPSTCDDDNLAGALKSIRDEIARWLGIDDRKRDIVRYCYEQHRGAKGEWGVRIEFGAAPVEVA